MKLHMIGFLLIAATLVAAPASSLAAPAPVWRTAVGGDGTSSPVEAGGRLFVGTANGLVGLDPATGAIIIVNSTPVAGTPGVIRGFDPQPDPPGKVIFGSRDGTLRAVSTEGEALWQVPLGAVPASPLVLQRLGEARARIVVGAGRRVVALDGDGGRLWSATLEGGDISRAASVLTAPGEPERVVVAAGARLYALDATTGAVLWTAAPSGAALGAPAVARSGNVVVGDAGGALFSLDARRGTVIGRFSGHGPIAGAAAIGDPTIFAGDAGGSIYAFDQTDDSQPPIPIQPPIPLWQFSLGGPVDGSPVLAGGVLYAATDPSVGRARLVALDATGGRVLLDAALPGGTAAAPLVVGGRVIVATRGGDLVAYDGPDS
jgi:outer membrane protein assembly factor BamB